MAKCQQLIELAIHTAQTHQIQLGRARALSMRPCVVQQLLHMWRGLLADHIEPLHRRIEVTPIGTPFRDGDSAGIQGQHAGMQGIRSQRSNFGRMMPALLGAQERVDLRFGYLGRDRPTHVDGLANAAHHRAPIGQQAGVVADRTRMASACADRVGEIRAPQQVGVRTGDGVAPMKRSGHLVGMAHGDQHSSGHARLLQALRPDRGQQRHARVLDGP